MRKLQERTRSRSLCAGLTVAATAAAVMASAPAAFGTLNSDVAFTTTPATGGLTGTLTVTGTDLFDSVTTPAAFFSTSSCTPAYNTSTPATVATVTKTNNDSGTVTIGTSAAALSLGTNGVNKTYNLCIYSGTGAGTLEGHGTYEVGGTYSNSGGPQGGTIVATSAGTFAGVTTPGAYFVASGTPCGANYTTTGVTPATTIAKNSDDQITITVPATLPLASNLAKLYTLCVYNGTSGSSTQLLAGAKYQVAPAATTLNPTTGASGGGNTVTVTYPSTSPIFTTVQTYYAGFSTGGCPAAYSGIPAARQVATVTRVSTTQASVVVPGGVGGANNAPTAICFYSANNSSDSLIGATTLSAYTTTLAASTLSSTVGAGSLITVNITSTNANAFLNSTVPAAVFFPQNGTAQYCPGSYTTAGGGIAAAGARKASNTKASVQFPSTALDPGPYSVCVYTSNDAATSKIAAVASYTVAPVPAIRSVSPPTGPSLGGNTVTVNGANLPTSASGIQVTIGNVPVAANKITAGDATYFTFVAPPHSKGAVDLVIKTDVGTATLSGGYTYVNGISLASNTAPNTSSLVTLDIFGAGFFDYNFSSTANSGAHVYLVRGKYDSTLWPGSTTPTPKERTNVDVVQDCASVWVVDDSELLCNLDLTQTLTSLGTQSGLSGSRSVSFTGSTSSLIVTAGTAPATSTAGTPVFTQADVGKPVAAVNAKIDTGTVITKVINGYTAVWNKLPLATLTAEAAAVGFTDSARAVVAASTGATTLTADANATPFNQSYVGRLITETGGGTDIPTATYITGVNAAGTTLTLSQPLQGAVASSVEITDSNAVPSGAYTVQIVGDATPGSSTPNASAVSAGSTFTVANF